MGLAERRGIERFKNDDYPAWKSRIAAAAGFDVPVEVNWDELAVANVADRYAEFFPKTFFQPLVGALSAISCDEIGKSALREGLKEIVIRNTDKFFNPEGISFVDGVLTFDHRSNENVDDGEKRMNGLRQVLESAL